MSREQIEKTCAYCDKQYQTYRNASKYCSDVCSHWAGRKRTPLEELSIYESWRAGKSLRKIGEEVGLSATRVGRICKRYERAELPNHRTKKTATHK